LKHLAVLIATLSLVLIPACGDGSAAGGDAGGNSVAAAPLDCGEGKTGAEHAVRAFFAILRSGDEDRVLDALAPDGRFEWITIYDKTNSALVDVRGNRRAAATAVADYGGLPLRVTDFSNIDSPSRTTDFGFRGTWRGREIVGKGALDCAQGRARVLSIGLPFEAT